MGLSDLLKGLTGGGWAGLYAWVFPSALTFGTFWLFVFPQLDEALREPFENLPTTEQTAIFIAASVGLGLIGNALSTPLYRLLEGYAWPHRCSRFFVQRQRRRKHRLMKEYDKLQNGRSNSAWQAGLVFEQLSRFPDDDREVAPTRLGNAMRAFETYGWEHFRLDSQSLWQELCSAVPKYLQDELDRSRAIVDFFIAIFYLAALFGLTAMLICISKQFTWGIAVAAVAAFASMVLWYRMAVVSTSYQAVTVRALVNIGRLKLAQSLGLQMPRSLEEERQMWEHLGGLVSYAYDPATAAVLDCYRKQPSPTNPGKTASDEHHQTEALADAEAEPAEDTENGEDAGLTTDDQHRGDDSLDAPVPS